MPTYTKSNFKSDNNSYIRINQDDATYSLVGANQKEYQSNGGSVVFTENLKQLNRGTYEGVSLTDSQISTYLSGSDPLSRLETTRTEAQTLYWKTLDDEVRQQVLGGAYGNDWKGKFDTEESANLLNGSNFGAQSGIDGQQQLRSFSGVSDGSGSSRSVGNANISAVLKYPIDMDLNIQDHMVITAATRLPAKLPSIDKFSDTGQFVRTRNNQLHETIIIPMPNAIASVDAVSFGKGEMGSVASGIIGEGLSKIVNESVAGGDTLGKIGEAALKAGQAALRGIGDAAGSGYIKRKLLLQGAATAAGAIGLNVDVDQVVNRLSGAIENPNMELLFQGASLREFDFNIRFTPRSSREAARVRQIIRILKRRMAVKRNGNNYLGGLEAGGKNLLLGTPDVFRLEYRRGSTTQEEIKGLNKFKTCVLQSLQVDYSGASGRWAAYGKDSQPVTTLLIMKFREIVPIYEEDYTTSGFASDDVGF